MSKRAPRPSSQSEGIDSRQRGHRVDAPHSISGPQGAPADAPVSALSATPLPSSVGLANSPGADATRFDERVHTQAEELGAALEARSRELDERAAELDEALAEARKWLGEQEQEINDRAKRLASAERELADRSANVARAEQRLADETARRRRTEPNPPRRDEFGTDDFDLRRMMNELVDARKRLEAAQSEFEEERRQWELRAKAHQNHLEAEHRRRLADIERREEDVNSRHGALAGLREELNRVHAETLEMRLVTEQLWSRLADHVAPPLLTRSVAELRSALADQYRLAAEEQHRRKAELESLRDSLASQHERLGTEKSRLDAWIGRRNRELDEREARLQQEAARLEAERREQARRERRWQEERLALEAELAALRMR